MEMTITFKVSDNVQKKMISFYEDKKRSKNPPYAIFQADDADSNITLYTSGKVVFQGKSADIEAQIWKDLDFSLNNRDIDAEIERENQKKQDKPKELPDLRFKDVATLGSDEVGTGDYFGPIVVTAAFVDKYTIKELNKLGVKDSKKLTDDKIMHVAPALIRIVPHKTYVLNNEVFNKSITNMNQAKAILHNKVLVEMVKQDYKFDYIVVDQFCSPKNYYNYINKSTEVCTNITFTTKAEDKCYAVAVSSIISRYVFLNELKKIGDKYQIFIKKGAGADVDQQAAMLVEKHGIDVLNLIAKVSFKNTEKVKNIVEQNKKNRK